MSDLEFEKNLGYRIGKWGGTFSATQTACNLICNGEPITVEQAQAVVEQLKKHKKHIWDNFDNLPHPQCGNDIEELNQLIDGIGQAVRIHLRVQATLAAFKQTKDNYSQAFEQLAD